MSNSEKLSEIQKEQVHGGQGLTIDSEKQENELKKAVESILKSLNEKFPFLEIKIESSINLKEIVEKLKQKFPEEEWIYTFESSNIKPDGGILFIKNFQEDIFLPILISEAKKQGTNDKIKEITGKTQACGNAIERLGKNVIGLRTWLKDEKIFPFVCFGYGWDFNSKSTILDRVVTIAEYGELNKIYLMDTEHTKRGCFYFKEEKWSIEEMKKVLLNISQRAIFYYFSKYGEDSFRKEK
ncbi:EcoRI family type II restriction endonuclease [Mycoplasmopsis hyopharyngis]|uniref:EcoRI family type II restriction endonuclease n=1 Tax=Mycoplasmopsis hyopharyngis TaxID=29558 RepID=UPI003872E838